MEDGKCAVQTSVCKSGQIGHGFIQIGPAGQIPPGDTDQFPPATATQLPHERIFIFDIGQTGFEFMVIIIRLPALEDITTVNQIDQHGRITCAAGSHKIAESKDVF